MRGTMDRAEQAALRRDWRAMRPYAAVVAERLPPAATADEVRRLARALAAALDTDIVSAGPA